MKIFTVMTFTAWKKTNWIFLLWLILSLVSCKQEKTPLENDIKTYLSTKFEDNNTYTQNTLYLFLPLDICNTCLEQTNEFLRSQPLNKNLHLVIVAKTKREIKDYSAGLEEKYTILSDVKGNIYSYPNLAQSLPLLMSIQEGEVDIVPFSINENFELMQEKVRDFNQ